MTLTLRAISLNEQPLTQPITARFDVRGGTIGRADDNLLALPDPERHISRQQAQISQSGRAYRIRNVGSANPVLVRGLALGPGESAALAHGDQVRIGAYLLEAIEEADDDAYTLLRSRRSRDVAAPSPSAAPLPLPAADVDPLRDRAPVAPQAATGSVLGAWEAFCEGAGLRVAPPAGPSPESMHAAGAMLRAAVDGVLQLMSIREGAPPGIAAQPSVIQSRDNNPLTFSPDAPAALEQLLRPPLRGFLDGPTAMRDAMGDLIGHSVGTLAGMRAALEGVLEHFSPPALEARLSHRSAPESAQPADRRARLWELYSQHAPGLRSEAQDDFDSLFGEAYRAAYARQTERMQRAAPTA